MTCDYIKLQQSGQAYPRTCPECGLGPCKYRTMTAAIKDAGDDVVEPILWAPEKNGNMMPVARDERLVEYVWHEDYKKLQSAYKRACVERGAFKQYWLAVDHRMVVLHLGTADSFDADTCMNKILEWETTIALDPQVSRPAQELKDTYLQRAEKAEAELAALRLELGQITGEIPYGN